MKHLAVTVGVITYEGSFVNFTEFLLELKPELARYPGNCELLVISNSGASDLDNTLKAIQDSDIESICTCQCIVSEDNNIAIARNLLLENASFELIAMIDDDEFPVPGWLTKLCLMQQKYNCGIVAGPAYPLYLYPAPFWVRHLDLHSSVGKTSGQILNSCSSANVLLHRSKIKGERFNPDYGVTGGEDSDFIGRQVAAGTEIRWCQEAVVYEYIPENKSSSTYMIKRCLHQGALNRRILTSSGKIRSTSLFVLRSLVVSVASILIGGFFLILKNKKSSRWLQRAFGNLGHCISMPGQLYRQAPVAEA